MFSAICIRTLNSVSTKINACLRAKGAQQTSNRSSSGSNNIDDVIGHDKIRLLGRDIEKQ